MVYTRASSASKTRPRGAKEGVEETVVNALFGNGSAFDPSARPGPLSTHVYHLTAKPPSIQCNSWATAFRRATARCCCLFRSMRVLFLSVEFFPPLACFRSGRADAVSSESPLETSMPMTSQKFDNARRKLLKCLNQWLRRCWFLFL